MSQRKYNVKCFYRQPKGRAKRKRNGIPLRRLWFKGDSCPPTALPTHEVEERLEKHMAELGQLVPSSHEYALTVALVHLYDVILRHRKAITIELNITHA